MFFIIGLITKSRFRSDALAIGTVNLDMNCTTDADSTNHCALKTPATFNTNTKASHLDPSTACAYSSTRYESWQLENWQRSYEMNPGSVAPGSTTPPPQDSGPSFTLKNMAGGDVFRCSTLTKGNSSFQGSCNVTATGDLATSADFSFDPELDILTVTQHWACSNS